MSYFVSMTGRTSAEIVAAVKADMAVTIAVGGITLLVQKTQRIVAVGVGPGDNLIARLDSDFRIIRKSGNPAWWGLQGKLAAIFDYAS
jgi:hypothetical protein